MEDFDSLIRNARSRGLDDGRIKFQLIEAGLNEVMADALLAEYSDQDSAVVPAGPESEFSPDTNPNTSQDAGLVINPDAGPDDPDQSPPDQSSSGQSRVAGPAIRCLALWLYTGTLSVMTVLVSLIVFHGREDSLEALSAFVVLVLLAYGTFAYYDWRYFRNVARAGDDAGESRWVKLTLALHLLALVAVLVAMLLAITLVVEASINALLAGGAVLVLLYLQVVAAYGWAEHRKYQSAAAARYLSVFPVSLLAVAVMFCLTAGVWIMPLQHDRRQREAMAGTVVAIRTYTETSNALPTSLEKVKGAHRSLVYKRTDKPNHYQLCARFRSDQADPKGKPAYINDSYVNEASFRHVEAGENCWTIIAGKVAGRGHNALDELDIPKYRAR